MIDLKASKLIDEHFPEIYKGLLNNNGNNKIAAFECNKENELRLMKVHYENAKLFLSIRDDVANIYHHRPCAKNMNFAM